MDKWDDKVCDGFILSHQRLWDVGGGRIARKRGEAERTSALNDAARWCRGGPLVSIFIFNFLARDSVRSMDYYSRSLITLSAPSRSHSRLPSTRHSLIAP